MIRKLLAGASVLAVAVIAVMLMTVGGSAKPAEAHVTIFDGPASVDAGSLPLEIILRAQEDHGDVFVTASAGTFLFCFEDIFTDYIGDECDWDAYNFSDPFPIIPIQQALICDDGTDYVYDPDLDDYVPVYNDCYPNGNGDGTDFDEIITLVWAAPPGFPGGAVLFTACQEDEDPEDFPHCTSTQNFTTQVVGAPASIKLFAQRDISNQATVCTDTPVYVIPSVEYDYDAVFVSEASFYDFGAAVICAEVTDSAGHRLTNEPLTWTVSGGGCMADGTSWTTSGQTFNLLRSCDTGNSGEIATVTASAGVTSNPVMVEFGGNPASCSIPDIGPLDIGDGADFTATFVDEFGNKVPDGIIAHVIEVDSGDGGDNVDVVSVAEDTVNSEVTGTLIGAISGLTTIAVNLETYGDDVGCTEAVELTGDVHQTPGVCDDEDFILYGNQPPAGGGFGTFAFCGGTYDQLLEASGCPEETAVFFYNEPSGGFEVWIPGSDVAAVNAEILERWPMEHTPIPEGTIFTAKCK